MIKKNYFLLFDIYILTYFLLGSGTEISRTNQFLSMLSKFFKKIVRFIRVKYRKITMNKDLAQTLSIYILWLYRSLVIEWDCYPLLLLS